MNYSECSPGLPGCLATGNTIEETLIAIRSAICFHVEGMLENGDETPMPRSLDAYVHDTDEISVDDILTRIEVEVPDVVHA